MFTFAVQTACCFIKNQDWSVFQKCSGNCDTLPLTAGKFDTTFSDQRFIFLWEFFNKCIRVCHKCCFFNLFKTRLRHTIANIFFDCAMEHAGILWHKSYRAPETFQSYFLYILSVNRNYSLLNIKMSEKKG